MGASDRWEQAASEFEDSYDDQREIRGAIFNQPLKDVPRREALVVQKSATVAEAIAAMNERHVGCALIAEGDQLLGIFTERDVLRKVAMSGMNLAKTPITEVMTRAPDTLPGEASIAFALRKMSHEGYRHVPLVGEGGKLSGVVAVRDIVSWFVGLFPPAVLNLPPEPGFPKTVDGG
jgi:CBS domain-containing protein